MYSTRVCKTTLVAITALFSTLITFNNLTDYGTNWQFVTHVLSMDTVWAEGVTWRAIQSTTVHHIFYALIIFWEALTAVVCWWGSYHLWQAWAKPASVFNRAKKVAIVGLTLSLVQWFLFFMTVGAEWFYMWASDWNGQDAAFRMFGIVGISLIFLVLPDRDLDPESTG